ILSPQPTKKARFTRAFCVRTVIDGDFNLHQGSEAGEADRGTEKPNHDPQPPAARRPFVFGTFAHAKPVGSRLCQRGNRHAPARW
ncbi:hypothetical protein, partial [Mesorhizobium sp. LSJC269B00]|uniref:hypothetical protein n=2 Tax=Mesorhizobium TaxID=68287 RepID=UPI001AEBC85C